MNIPRSMVEAGARALANASNESRTLRLLPAWDDAREPARKAMIEMATAAIRAAIGCGNWVMCRRPTAMTLSQDGAENFRYDLRDGDTILIVRAEKGGEQ